MIVKVQNSSINLQEYPLSLIDRGQRRLSFWDSITTALQHTLVLVIPFQNLLLDLSLLFFFCLDYMKKKREERQTVEELGSS